MTRWKSITVETRREAVDALSHFFTEHGALGMAYDERLFGPEGDPADPLPPPDEVTRLTAYFPWESDLHSVKRQFLDFLPVLAESFGMEGGASSRRRRLRTSAGRKSGKSTSSRCGSGSGSP